MYEKMREILFRGKSKRTNEWLFVDYEHFHVGNDLHVYIDDWGKNLEEVVPETVGQFTGLTDKNGKKIFEGDILKDVDGAMDGIPRIVYWSGYDMAFKCPLVKKHWAYGTNDIPLKMMRYHNIEVIGNIHDNPELLKEENDG